ncbi:methylated-DNA--[protein]-cysteine S-methyltransferase [Micromonospora deserti]|uniref:Methylated-DNA--protein-cysteine methyltransferase n=1 Tax=Micromonospora deserti TaxID=2070366 RepID=A0A2W2DA84_9ACTN|nr:methylated-DNA--[protein]-cysteine S-methyltransferase [Micromonospora deserti]PZG02245.1 cysteine methyltransferase [Micromonospora deserti]
MRWTVLDSPIGEFSVATDDGGVCGAHFGRVEGAVTAPADELSRRVVAELRAYFAGELTEFAVPVSVRRGSDFERAVWREMTLIPYAGMLTYGEVARQLGDPGAARAVGVACNRNPVPVIVPCHRIVGAGSKLIGFGGGLDRKRFLLELEARVDFERSLLGLG